MDMCNWSTDVGDRGRRMEECSRNGEFTKVLCLVLRSAIGISHPSSDSKETFPPQQGAFSGIIHSPTALLRPGTKFHRLHTAALEGALFSGTFTKHGNQELW